MRATSVRTGRTYGNTSSLESTSVMALKTEPPQKTRFTSLPEWTKDNISSRGSLGTLYRVWGDGKQMVKDDPTDYFGLSGYTAEELKKKGYMVWMAPQIKGSFLGEGDTPTFLNLIDNGLRAYENPRWGGWGGWMQSDATGFPAFGAPPPILPADTSGIARGLAPAGSDSNKPSTPKEESKMDFSELSSSRCTGAHCGDCCPLLCGGRKRLCSTAPVVSDARTSAMRITRRW